MRPGSRAGNRFPATLRIRFVRSAPYSESTPNVRRVSRFRTGAFRFPPIILTLRARMSRAGPTALELIMSSLKDTGDPGISSREKYLVGATLPSYY